MKSITALCAGFGLGLGALIGTASAQENIPPTIVTSADGHYVVAGPGQSADGSGGNVWYDDITTGGFMTDSWSTPATVTDIPSEEPPPPVTGDGTTAPPPADPGTSGTGVDSDADNLTDDAEAVQGTDPGNPDSDGDLWADGDELNAATNPLDPDSDDDGVLDGTELNGSTTSPPTSTTAPGMTVSETATSDTAAEPGDASTLGDGSASAAPGTVS